MIKAEKFITENFDLWTSGVKAKSIKGRGTTGGNDSYGIKKLRRLILKLATEGLLTEQDSKDECASDQLKRIKQAEMDNKKNRKKQKSVKTAILEPEANSLPSGWATTKLESLVTVLNGRAYKKNELLNSGTPVLRVGNLFTSSHWYYSDLVLEDDKYCQSGDLIFAWSASFGPFIWKGPKAIYHYHIWKLLPHREEDISKNFLLLVLQEKTEAIKNEGHGVAMLHMTKAKMEKLLIRLPPLAEQKRIVAKVDKLMSLCDQLEKKQNNNIETHNILISSLLNAFTSATTDSSNFFQAWQSIKTNFDILFSTETSLEQLKKAILQIAIMGRLVPQNRAEGSAIEELKLIENKKALLIKGKQIKKKKLANPINPEEEPYSLPINWQWCRLGQIGIGSTGKTPKTIERDNFGGDIEFIGPGEITEAGKILNSQKTLTQKGLVKSIEALPKSILMVCIGGSIGKSAIVQKRLAFNQQINALYPIDVQSKYINIVFSSNFFQLQIQDHATGSATPIINRAKWENLLIPIPPIAEQHRIIEKVDELFLLCEKLKESFSKSQNIKINLVDSLVDEAIDKS